MSLALSHIGAFLGVGFDPTIGKDFNKMWDENLWNLEEVLSTIRKPGTVWGLDRKKRLYRIRRSELLPVSKEWYDFVQSSLLPSSSCSDVSGKRAYLI